MEVEVLQITPQSEMLIESAARTCYQSQDKMKEDSRSEFIMRLIKAGHLSVLEHAYATFRLRRISRALTHQLVRHRLCSYSQQSQRYVSEEAFEYVIPPRIKECKKARELYIGCMEKLQATYKELRDMDIPREDARYVLANSCNTEIVFTCNFRELRHIMKLRGKINAQWEIRELFIAILKLIKRAAPACFFDMNVNEDKRVIEFANDKEN
ncbi:FAD-dependent thymidylate synthase [Elusimicrobiota bacterium]